MSEVAGSAHDAARGRTYQGRSHDQRTAERRRRMLDAAVELFGTRGFNAVSITDLCAAARVSRRSFYEEFGALDRLLIAAVDEFDARAAEQVGAVLIESAEDDLATRAQRAFRAFLSATCPDRRTARVCFIEVVQATDQVEIWRRERRRRLAWLLVTQAESAAQRDEIPSRPFHFTAITMIGAVTYAIQEWVDAEPVFNEFATAPTEWMADQLSQMFVAAVSRPGL
ncbi:TetR/AcrR family transcriptional regulator [Nocardia sp. CDC159]|uniref:TetR/AcrR family transcriptional regulator n=1 Tax=Nocardia pulmonis TaxID=2951408 RepID=A0A9X2EDS3_9NOCA|nr:MULTISPECIES: TetR/AcrR family transcriptional regulator [Nocardia]MCM6778564.1 TetR/AcrR family transcriptional regulator [Nocardia pulmonis]MCM6791453.1 TetR/AcrR family transcriptional regulator [Nocardia sp. CDC159]